MRVGGGTARGRRLSAKGRGGVRPTANKVVDALFNSLAARVEEARVLDLFAGTGRLGIEALSRGAGEAVFVERDARNAVMIKDNLASAEVAAQGEVRRGNALTEIAALALAGRQFDLIILDPPYGRGLQRDTLRRIAATAILAPDGLIVAEGHWRDEPGDVPGLEQIRSSRYGETALWVYAHRAKKEDGV